MPPQRRETRQRAAVSAALDDVDSFVSAQDLHARLRAAGNRIGLTTVYRALAAMAGAAEADVLTADGQQVYRACGSGEHHHHLVCRRCGRAARRSRRITSTGFGTPRVTISGSSGAFGTATPR